jgi:hypothetical protein
MKLGLEDFVQINNETRSKGFWKEFKGKKRGLKDLEKNSYPWNMPRKTWENIFMQEWESWINIYV